MHWMKPCCHCGREMPPRQLPGHEDTCLDNPAAAAATRAALLASSVDGAIGPQAAYNAARAAYPGVPSAMAAVRHLGSWAAVAEWAGLASHDRRNQIDDDVLGAHVEELRTAAERAEDDYPLLPGTWKRKAYAIWPSGATVTGLVYELR